MEHRLEMGQRDRRNKWNFLEFKARSLFLKNNPAFICSNAPTEAPEQSMKSV